MIEIQGRPPTLGRTLYRVLLATGLIYIAAACLVEGGLGWRLMSLFFLLFGVAATVDAAVHAVALNLYWGEKKDAERRAKWSADHQRNGRTFRLYTEDEMRNGPERES